jgi:UDP-N-acetylglucosamine 4,6-dehydratase
VSSVEGRSILVTGASGSLGLALLRRISEESPSEIRALQRSSAIANTLRDVVPLSIPLRVISADIADAAAVYDAMHGVDLVFHLAGLKDVVVCERHPGLAVRSNVTGTEVLVAAAQRLGGNVVVVGASSDKASLGASVLGLTKALMERILIAAGVGSSVRLGGVLESSGSVLDVWRRSARERGVIDVTDPEMTRFVMTKAEAVSALLRASERGWSGEILIPTMRRYKLADLAAVFARTNGAQLRIVGTRPGEERHAVALSTFESAHAVQDGEWRVFIPGRWLGGIPSYRSDHAEALTVSEMELITGVVART